MTRADQGGRRKNPWRSIFGQGALQGGVGNEILISDHNQKDRHGRNGESSTPPRETPRRADFCRTPPYLGEEFANSTLLCSRNTEPARTSIAHS